MGDTTAYGVFKGTARYKGWYTAVTEEKHAYFAYSPKGYTTDEIGLKWLKKFNAQTKTELAASCFLMVTVPTTTFASVSTHGITRLFWYLTQAAQHTYYNVSMWDCLHCYKKHMEIW